MARRTVWKECWCADWLARTRWTRRASWSSGSVDAKDWGRGSWHCVRHRHGHSDRYSYILSAFLWFRRRCGGGRPGSNYVRHTHRDRHWHRHRRGRRHHIHRLLHRIHELHVNYPQHAHYYYQYQQSRLQKKLCDITDSSFNWNWLTLCEKSYTSHFSHQVEFYQTIFY